MRKVALVVVALALLQGPVGAAERPAGTPARSTPRTLLASRPAAPVLVHTEDGPSLVGGSTAGIGPALDAALRSDDPRGGVHRAVTEALRAHWGERLIDVSALRRDPAAGDEEPGPSIDRWGFGGGDLDGDGLDDVLSFEIEYPAQGWMPVRQELLALRGADGVVLWRYDLEDASFVLALTHVDFTGDGIVDPLILRDSLSYFGGSVACSPYPLCDPQEDPGQLEFEWDFAVLDGRKGTAWWGLDGVTTVESTNTAYVASQGETTNLAPLPMSSPDLDGDGGDDLVLNIYSVRSTSASAVVGSIRRLEYASDMRVLSGATGSEMHRRGHDFASRMEALSPGGNLTGDATDDFVHEVWDFADLRVTTCTPACASNREYTVDVSAVDGGTFEPSWTIRLPDPVLAAWVLPALADLDADGHEDLIVDEFPRSGERLRIVAQGSTVWMSDADWVAVVGPIGGAPGADVIQVRWNVPQEQEYFALDTEIVRTDGASGAVLSNQSFHYDDLNGGESAHVLSTDADGDGTLDLLVEATSGGPDDIVTTVRVESGRTSETLATATMSGWRSLSLPGDATGDGLADIAAIAWGDASVETSVTMIDAASGQDLWKRSFWFGTEAYSFGIEWTEDQGGSASPLDVVVSRTVYGDRMQSRVEGLEGQDGSTRWGYGDDLSPSPGLPAQLSGRILSGGSRFEGACAEISSPDFGGGVGADADGSFVFPAVPPGSYRLRARDCASHAYTPRWYGGDSSIDSAVLIALAPGEAFDAGTLSLDPAPRPANDDVANATAVPALPFDGAGATPGGSQEPGEDGWCSAGGGPTVWYRLEAIDGGLLDATVAAGYYASVAIFAGTPAGPLAMLSCGRGFDAHAAWLASPGDSVWVQVGGAGDAGPFDLALARIYP